MHYVITGGCGFIGSHLADKLLASGHTVAIIDDLSSGSKTNAPAKAIVHVGDITTPGIFDSFLSKADGVFHLAAIASVVRSQSEWLRSHHVNSGGIVALFDAIARSGRRIPVVYSSSAAVYGNGSGSALSESAPTVPLSAYGADKLACESHGRIASSLHGIPTIGLRLFNVYGERQDASSPYSGVISIFAERMKKHLPVTIYGDGTQARDFLHVRDTVSCMENAMKKLRGGTAESGIYNVCTGTATSISALADTMKTLIRSKSILDHAPRRAGDILLSLGDNSAAKAALGFAPEVTLEEGLSLTLR